MRKVILGRASGTRGHPPHKAPSLVWLLMRSTANCICSVQRGNSTAHKIFPQTFKATSGNKTEGLCNPATLLYKWPLWLSIGAPSSRGVCLKENSSHCTQILTLVNSCIWFGLMKPEDLIYNKWRENLVASLKNTHQLTFTNPQKCHPNLPNTVLTHEVSHAAS